MKTTVDIPDTLYRRAKIRAAERGVTLKTLLISAFERMIADDALPVMAEEPEGAYLAKSKPVPTRASKPVPTRASKPVRAARAGRGSKKDEYLGFTVNEFGIPVLKRRPGDTFVITNEMIRRMRDDEGI